MKAFFVGVLVILIMAVLSVVGIFLFPMIVALTFFLRWVVSVALIIFVIWFIGKITLWGIENIKKNEKNPSV